MLILLMFIFLSSVAPTRADDSAWSVWLYEPTCPAPKIVRVTLDGQSTVQPFGCPDSGDFPAPVAFSADMTRMAYCKYGSVRIVDFAEDFNYHVEINDSGDCSITPAAFDSADKRWLAVGTTHYVDSSVTNPPRAYGELIILDVDGVAIAGSITTDSAALAPYYRRSYPNTADMPYVRDFEAGRVVFSPIFWSSEMPPRFQSMLIWQVGSAKVTPTTTEGQLGEDRLTGSGDSVWYDADPGFPQGVSSAQASVYNVVLWAAPGEDARVVYTAPLAISDTMFIDGGRRIAFRLSAVGRPDRWLALDRSGHTTELPVAPLVGTPDGYLYLDSPNGAVGAALYRVSGDAPPRLLWQDVDSSWRVARSTPLSAPLGALPPFPAITLPG